MLSIVAKVVKHLAARRRYGIVHDTFVDRHAQATFCREMFDRLAVDFVLDIGANTGQYRQFVRRDVGYAGRGVSYEPVPQFVAEMRQDAQGDPLWSVEQIAVGAEQGTAEFNVMRAGELSSFLAPSAKATDRFRDDNTVGEKITVRVTTVDALLPVLQRQYGFSRPFLKIDTQGFDLQVLRGALGSLDSIAGIQTELSWIPIYEGSPAAHDVMQFLEHHGFDLAGLYRTNSAGYPTFLAESDGYFARRGAE